MGYSKPAFTGPDCEHDELYQASSLHASEVGYCRPSENQRVRAAVTSRSVGRTRKGLSSQEEKEPPCFPAPLALPGDDLSLDPKQDSQSLDDWLKLKERNKISARRNAIYVAQLPEVTDEVEFVRSWSYWQKQEGEPDIAPLQAKDVLDYLVAFYHGLPVKPFPEDLRFISWTDTDTGTTTAKKQQARPASPRHIGLAAGMECTRIRTRKSPDGIFKRQLNLDDLLDAAISMLPKDAYALLLLVDHDLYEDEDDVFVCGRAYGGSRVAVVSTARYHPNLDDTHNVDRLHSWPASHCKAFIEDYCDDTMDRSPSRTQSSAKKTKVSKWGNRTRLPGGISSSSTRDLSSSSLEKVPTLHDPVAAYKASVPPFEHLSGLWLSRVCRTVSHELGHCFGMDHCVYYACSMQGSASLPEDARQPPYLCPVDLAKLLHATGGSAGQRYEKLLLFCERHSESPIFAAFGEWIRGRLREMEANHGEA